jgi:dTDP-4-dehydrorhamnose reductase
VRGIVLSMRAIREVNSDARLVQTEDAGYVRSTPSLAYQAEFENERRWLTFDLLAGRVDRDHPMHGFLLWCGLPEQELMWFVEHPTPAQVIGIDYYVLSDRYLDDSRPQPADCHDGNGRHRYQDVAAAKHCGIIGVGAVLKEAWERYRVPLAVAEAHLAGTVEEQIRWLVSMWDGVCEALRGGADVRALTVWSLLGAWDWDSLCTTHGSFYEPGIFDVRGRSPQVTPLAQLLDPLMRGVRPAHPALGSAGWWQPA